MFNSTRLKSLPSVILKRQTCLIALSMVLFSSTGVLVGCNKDYQDNYRKVIKAAIAEFGNQPWIGYFRFGIGVGAESYPGNGVSYANNPCHQQWTKPPINLSQELWQAHSLDFIDFLGTLETSKTILVTINNYGRSYDVAREVAAYAAEKGFGIGTQGLTKNALNLYAQGKNCYADWCNLSL